MGAGRGAGDGAGEGWGLSPFTVAREWLLKVAWGGGLGEAMGEGAQALPEAGEQRAIGQLEVAMFLRSL